MNNIFVYCEIENGQIADVSLELLTKGRELAATLGCKIEAVAIGHSLSGIEQELAKYGADTVWVADGEELAPYRTLPHCAVMCGLIEEQKPQIVLFGATPVGRDLAPRVSSTLHSGLTADCTSLVIGDHKDAKTGKEYKNLLYQIRPAFGGNIIATIVNPDHRPQMATVREGVMKKEFAPAAGKAEVKEIAWRGMVRDTDLAVKIVERQIEERKINIKGASVIVAGGYGMGSKENFALVHQLADVLGAEVGASRAAVDAGFTDHARQVGKVAYAPAPLAAQREHGNDHASQPGQFVARSGPQVVEADRTGRHLDATVVPVFPNQRTVRSDTHVFIFHASGRSGNGHLRIPTVSPQGTETAYATRLPVAQFRHRAEQAPGLAHRQVGRRQTELYPGQWRQGQLHRPARQAVQYARHTTVHPTVRQPERAIAARQGRRVAHTTL